MFKPFNTTDNYFCPFMSPGGMLKMNLLSYWVQNEQCFSEKYPIKYCTVIPPPPQKKKQLINKFSKPVVYIANSGTTPLRSKILYFKAQKSKQGFFMKSRKQESVR
jgi:hypothetical protein